MAKEITTRSGLNVVVLEKKLRPDMQLLIVEGATQEVRSARAELYSRSNRHSVE